LFVYEASTPGVSSADNTTARLDLDNEPQPDAMLFIEPARGGQVRISEDDYIEGAPELVAEVASSSVSFDLHTKFHVYRRSGVKEYVVWRVLDRAVDWFVLVGGAYERLEPDDGLFKSRVFPGLWLDAEALIGGELARVVTAVQKGLASSEHEQFVRRLAGSKRE
jgi:Uma2 family endonuclease